MGWLSDTTTSCASTTSTLKSDIIEAWKRRKKKNHRKEAWKCCKKKEAAAEVGPAKAGPTPAKAGPPAKVDLNTGYSWLARVNTVLASKPPLSSISLMTKLYLSRGYLYIWVTLPLCRIDMN
jgi:hypothetical protein